MSEKIDEGKKSIIMRSLGQLDSDMQDVLDDTEESEEFAFNTGLDLDQEIEEPDNQPVEYDEFVSGRFDKQNFYDEDEERSIDYVESTGLRIDEVPESPKEEFDRQASIDIAEKISKIEEYNAKLERSGLKRRYIASSADLPSPDKQVFKDDFGEYYYITKEKISPSDVVGDEMDWYDLSEVEKIEAVIKHMQNVYPLYTKDVSDREDVDMLLSEILITEKDTAKRYDAFDVEFKRRLVDLIESAK